MMNPGSLLSGFFSDFAIAMLADSKTRNLVESNVESYMLRQSAYFSGWSAGKLEYAARSLRRQERILHELADGKSVITPRVKYSQREKNRRELISVIRDCWVE